MFALNLLLAVVILAICYITQLVAIYHHGFLSAHHVMISRWLAGRDFVTIRLSLPDFGSLYGHLTLFFPRDASAKAVASLWNCLVDNRNKMRGSFEITGFTSFGPKRVALGKLVGEIATFHKESWKMFHENGSIVSEMPKSEQERVSDGYFFTAHISVPDNFDESGMVGKIIPLVGNKVQIKALGLNDAFMEMTI